MPETIFQWINRVLKTDVTLAALWGEPDLNPFAVASSQQSGGAGNKFPYCVYYVVKRVDKPVYGNPRGIGNEWIFSFAILAQGSDTESGAKQARQIFKRVDDIFGTTMDVIGVQLVTLELGPIEHWFEIERAYRIIVDYRFQENLACT